jgi:hypothetical protein
MLLAPVVAPGGVRPVIRVLLTTVRLSSSVPPTATLVTPTKFVPVIVTRVPPPAGPVLGLTLITLNDGGAVELEEEHATITATRPIARTARLRRMGPLWRGHLLDGGFVSRAYRHLAKDGVPQSPVQLTADLVAALKVSNELCARAYAQSDADALKPVSDKSPSVRFSLLVGNVAHVNEHYGNLVTYLRLKGMIPPSSQRTMN